MTTITRSAISEHSNASSAVAVLQTDRTGDLCVIVILSTIAVGFKKYTTLYVNVEQKHGNVEQALALKTSPPDCVAAMKRLIAAPGFITSVLDPVIEKVLESQPKAP